MKLKRGKALTSTKMETVPLSGDAIAFLQRRHLFNSHCGKCMETCLFRIRTSESKIFLFGLFCYSFLHPFHFVSCLSPFLCLPLFLFALSFLFLSFCLVFIHLVSFCLSAVLLYSILVFQLLTNMSFFPSFLHFFFTSMPLLYLVFFILLSLLFPSVTFPSLSLHFLFLCFSSSPFLYLVL